tara:strand:+ start:488 stop:733 length:246 start_codon:yes stop_codon:yes gene_type:complete
MTDEKKNKRCPTDGMTDGERNAFIMGFEMCEESLHWGVNHPNRMPDHGCTLPPAIVEHREEVEKLKLKIPALLLLAHPHKW